MTHDLVPGALGAAGLAAEVEAVDHVGVATADLDATIAFYRDAFGMVEVHREENPDQQVVEAMLAPGGESEVPGATRIQVLAPLAPTSTIARFLDRSGPGLQQLALRVRDLDALSARLRALGLRLLYDEPRIGTAGCKINFLHPKDAGGVLIELVAAAPESLGR
ncbi:methylmalonyl-CoA epimerase [Microlunatus endophyticus]|uniref:Methylmalonyl-CoA epimerase n=1 Tax=Microlunatus endophyticus TaxID=1716077 RepID=A0A917W0X5_9ACTN|nr:methylmalonyl-CoA epimerase [Microlunatus endophyticus]GGL55268.1 methylmalonyl-CoA epimerase [Microlunatus endophyticus]